MASLLPFPPDEPLGERLGVTAVAVLLGAWMAYVGRLNVRSRQAEERGVIELFLRLAGKSTDIVGRRAVLVGWYRIVIGALAIVMGIAYGLFGAFLKK